MMRTSLLHIQPPEAIVPSIPPPEAIVPSIPTAIVPSIPPPEARPAIHKFYTRDRNVLLVRNLGVEDKDI